MWNGLTFLWNELTISWNDLTSVVTWNDVNDLTMERNDRLPLCPQQTTDEQIKIFGTENTESDTFCMEDFRKIHHCRLNLIVTLKIEKVYTKTGTEVTVTV